MLSSWVEMRKKKIYQIVHAAAQVRQDLYNAVKLLAASTRYPVLDSLLACENTVVCCFKGRIERIFIGLWS